MITIRRIYVYLLAFAGLMMLMAGTANLGRVVIEAFSLPSTSGQFLREEVSRWGAAALIGLPVWLVHWWWAQRLATGSVDERSSTLRRLYLYAVLGVGLIAAAVSAHELLRELLDGKVSDAPSEIPTIVTGVVAWLFTWQVTGADREAVGEEGGSATLRRWYVYTVLVLGFLEVLRGMREVIEALWTNFGNTQGPGTLLDGVPDALVGLLIWVHAVRLTRRFAQADRGSTLRSVAAFIALAVVVGSTVYYLSQALYYALARAFGVERPAGVGGSLWEAAAGPLSGVLVYGLTWLRSTRRPIEVEAPRQLGAKRLYTYLVALVALTALAIGVGGLLWVVADALTHAPETTSGDWWRDRSAAFITATIVGLPLWLRYWKPSETIDAAEAHALSRRLYAYLVLIASSLTLLFSLASVVYRLLSLALGARSTSSLGSDLAHDCADALVAGALVAYHALALRSDARLAATLSETPGVPHTEAVLRISVADGARVSDAIAVLKKRGFAVEVLSEAPSATTPARTSPPAD